ncbi:HU family DNA-binding protein [Shimia aestuarii]|uniref:DNA-binding protein HU-alpha n=1 Tax=Shimia aestuarii TaxID=254406 RepID=A0A1I4LEI0_9RHOB|nr:HU family DNA-binding protein [Shimia aestuarii]SFL89330.1 DNA-binding protein HU-alpha [Shimia aestuarii]
MATTRKSSTTRKPATAKKTTRSTTSRAKKATTAPKAAPDATVVASEPTVVVAGAELKKKELIEAVVDRSGIKKRFAKPTIEAMLAVLGEALADGRPLNLQPLGKVKVHKQKEISGGKVLITRVRRKDNASLDAVQESASDPLADAAE